MSTTASAGRGRPLSEAPFFDPFDPELATSWERAFAALRGDGAVARTPLGATVVRREPMQRLLSDARLVSAIPFLVRMQGIELGPVHELVSSAVLSMDGPDHTRLRRLVWSSFTPRAADRHRPAMRALVQELLDPIVQLGSCELMSSFADHYPVQVICEVLGVPREHHDRFAEWGNALTHVLSLDLAAHADEVRVAAEALVAYIDEIVADRQRHPRDDLVTSLVQATDAGDRLSPTELRTMIGGLLFAGYDTTRNQLGIALVLFAQHPDQWTVLADNPELASNAVNEVMRFNSAVPGVPRITTEEIVVDGWVVPAGTIVFFSFASANRDEGVYDQPDVFDITAERDPPLTFGAGPHYCLGANLARAELEEALRILPARMRNLRLEAEPSWRMGTGISGPAEVLVSFDPSSG